MNGNDKMQELYHFHSISFLLMLTVQANVKKKARSKRTVK